MKITDFYTILLGLGMVVAFVYGGSQFPSVEGLYTLDAGIILLILFSNEVRRK